jgi:hypothetical protein
LWFGIGLFVVGVVAVLAKTLPAPAGSRPVRPIVYFFRGLAAAAAVGTAILITSLNPSAGGLVTSFPAIFSTTMVSVWLSQGRAVTGGSVAPMMLGSTSVVVYAIFFAEVFPILDDAARPSSSSLLFWLIVLFLSSSFVLFFLSFFP